MQRATPALVTPEPVKSGTIATFHPKSASPAAVQVVDDATLEFAVEPAAPAAQARINFRRLVGPLAGILLIGALAGLWVLQPVLRSSVAATGSLKVDSDPPGAEVRIDGEARGATPLTLSLAAGRHTLVVQQASRTKELPVDVVSGEVGSFHISWAEAQPVTVPAPTGSLSVASDSPDSVVSVDGTERGRAPMTVSGLNVGRHDVLVRSGSTVYRRSVQVESGATASLVITGTQAAASWGWIALEAPFPLQVLEEGKVVGTSDIDRIMLPPGDHDLQLVSEPFGFRQTSRVRIAAGRQADLPLTIPRVALNINALPWAEVLIDGARIGETPLANVMQPIGDHEVVFRHPQLGEKRQVARVTAQGSLRVSVDMRAR